MRRQLLDLVPMPSEKPHEVPAVRIPLRWGQMNDTQLVLDRRRGFVVAGPDVAIISDHDPTLTGHYGYPVRVILWYELSDRIMAADNHIIT